MRAVDDEVLSIGRELVRAGRNLAEIEDPYAFTFSLIRKVYKRNAIEAVLSKLHGYYNIGKAGYSASNAANDRYFKGRTDGTSGNALQHALWSAFMTRRVGADTAKLFADTHEFDVDMSNTGYLMDLGNNKRGRKAALSGRHSGNDIEEMTNNGQMVQLPLLGRVGGNGEWMNGESRILPTDGHSSYKLHPGLPQNEGDDPL